jgi:hypothetical protein
MTRSIILLLFGFTVFYLALRSLRAHRLKERYVLLLLLVGAPFVVLSFWPDAIVWISDKLSIEKPTVLVLALAGFVVLIVFELLSIVSVQERKIATLSQMVGLLNKELRDTKEKAERAAAQQMESDRPASDSMDKSTEKSQTP